MADPIAFGLRGEYETRVYVDCPGCGWYQEITTLDAAIKCAADHENSEHPPIVEALTENG
jgi:hypothetical protein